MSTIGLDSLSGDLLHEAELTLIKLPKHNLTFQIRSGGAMYLVNPGDDHATITKGSILTRFGKISFRQPSDNNAETFDASQDIHFSPEGSETCVLVDSSVSTLGELVNKRSEEKTSDLANICYHNMEMLPQGGFKLIQKTLVCARVKEQKLQGPCMGGNMGAFSDTQKLASESDWRALLWQCRWSNNGLMPVRPVIVFTKDVGLPGKQALSYL